MTNILLKFLFTCSSVYGVADKVWEIHTSNPPSQRMAKSMFFYVKPEIALRSKCDIYGEQWDKDSVIHEYSKAQPPHYITA